VTALFVVTTIIGLSAVVSTLVMFSVQSRADRDRPPFRLVGQAVGLLAAGVGGLAMTLADIGTLGFSVATVISWVVYMVLVYKVVLPRVRRRRRSVARLHPRLHHRR
jgi:O-antigen/teichoic acid export membrane protein